MSDTVERIGKFETFWATKWITDEATSLKEMADMLEGAAAEIRELDATGKVWLLESVDNGHAIFLTDDPEIAEKHGFEEPEYEDEEDDEE